MSIFLFILLYTSNFNFQFPIPLTDAVDISWDKGFISYYRLKDGVIVELEIQFFSTFQNYLYQLAIGSWRETKPVDQAPKGKGGGLLPTIDLPIAFPKPIAGIIGQGGELDISGSQRIEFGGSKTQNLVRQQSEFSRESWFPTLEMQQHLGVNLKGTVGEKIHVYIDHDSEREFDLKNTITLEYKGDEDEIVQSIRAGNTELSLPGITLIGGATPHKGLFGIKSESKIGPVNITTIASREEAENQSKSWKGGGVTQREMKISDIDFIRWRFFLLAPPKYVQSLNSPQNIYSGNPNLLPMHICSVHVFLDEEQTSNQGEGAFGEAFDIPIRSYSFPESVETGTGVFVEQQSGTEKFYLLNTTGINSTPCFAVLELNRSLGDKDLLAIQWTYIDWAGDTITVGEIVNRDTVKGLQVIKRASELDTHYVSWWYELKNIYSVGGADISDINLKVFKKNYGSGEDFEILPNSNTTYRKFLCLETDNGLLDIDRIFDQPKGIIIFPSQYPFVLSPSGVPVDSLGMESDSIYNVPSFTSINYQSKYYIWLQYKGVTTEYYLDMMNIIPESEVVTINGKPLQRGVDYEINYELGRIRFLTKDAENPNADIKVDFQYVPIFQPTAKNLIGTRAHSKIGESGELSSAFLYYSTSCLDFRPTLGNEPNRIILGEAVGNVTTNIEWLTRFVDKLPLIETEAPSSFTIQGNAGFSLPNPNTRGEVYLDDMEGAKSTTSLGISRVDWSYGSIPPGQEKKNFAQVQWFNPRNGIPAKDLYPNLPDYKRNETRASLKLRLPTADSWRYPTEDSVYWVSLQTCLLPGGMDFSQTEYLEVWVKGSKGKLHIDVATEIPEDCIWRDRSGNIKGNNGVLDTEDKGGINKNNRLDQGEDTGIDGIAGDDGAGVSGDDGNDDYCYDPGHPDDYSKINGTEGNGILDGEDLDRDNKLDMDEKYFTFEIDIANQPPTIRRDNGWKFFRIPIAEGEVGKIGIPQWECIKYARIWIDGLTKGDEIEIATLDIVGNKWRHQGSEQVKVSVKNNEENLDYTTPPIELKTDPYGRKEREQSLVLTYTYLEPGTEGGCYTLYTRPRNFIQYKIVQFYLRQPEKGKAKFFIRMGGDKSNYYEYRTLLSDTSWHSITVNLEEMAQLKLKKSSADTGAFVYGNYRIRGNPSFTNIGRIELGVINDETSKDTLLPIYCGEIWIDEIRLSEPRREPGVASNISISTKLADFANFSLSYRANAPYFQSLGTFASMRGVLATNSLHSVGLSGGFQVSKLMPSEWGLSIPLNIGITRSVSYPIYQIGSDVILTDEESKRQGTQAITRNSDISIAKTGSKNRLLKLTLDNINTRFSYRDNATNSFTTIDSSQNYQTSIGYGYSPKLPSIKIKGFEIRYYPQQISASTSYSYARAREYRMTEVVDTVSDSVYIDTVYVLTNQAPPTRGLTKGGGVSYNPINPLRLNYSTSITNDLNLEGNRGRYDALKKKYDTETDRTERAGASLSPSIFGFLSPSIDYSTSYQEYHPAQLDSLRNVGNSNTLSFRIPVNLSKPILLITGLRDEKQDIAARFGTPQWVLMQTEKIGRKLYTPSFSYTISRSSQFYSLLYPPDYKYRMGIEKYPSQWVVDSRNNAQRNRNYEISRVGFSTTLFSITGGWNKTLGESERMGSEIHSLSTKFPQLNLAVSGVERFISLNKWFNSITTSFDYTTTSSSSGPKNMPTTIGKDKNFGVGVQTQWKRGLSVGLSTDFLIRCDETIGVGARVIETRKNDYSLQGSYIFRAPKGIKFPLLSHIKWTSDLNFALTTSYSTEWSKNIRSDTPIRDSKSISVRPQISYNFSTAVTGGANINYTQNWDRTGSGNTRNVGLRFFAEFSF